jgi:glutamate 5-kinase
MGESKLDLLQGTLDLMVLQTLAAVGTQQLYRQWVHDGRFQTALSEQLLLWNL